MADNLRWSRRRFVAGFSAAVTAGVAGCTTSGGSGDGTDEIQDSDGDGVIDSEDYAPNDPDVQEKEDISKAPTQTPQPTPTPTPTPTSDSEDNNLADSFTVTSAPDSDGDGVVDSQDDFPDSADYSQLISEDSGTEHIEPGYYRWWKWSLEEPATFSFEVNVVDGSRIDAVLIDESEFDEFEDGEEYSYYVHGSDLETTSADKHLRTSAGSYRFILSNWDAGSNEDAEVEYTYMNAR